MTPGKCLQPKSSIEKSLLFGLFSLALQKSVFSRNNLGWDAVSQSAIMGLLGSRISCSVLYSVQCRLIIEEDTQGLTELDFINAERLSKEEVYRNAANSPERVNNYKPDIRSVSKTNKGFIHKRVKRNGVSRPSKLWPNGRIPYAISSHYTAHERALLARAVKQYHDKTCVRFVPRTSSEGDYLFVGKVDGCFSEVGRTSGVQVLSLDNGCMEYSTIIHEIMHVVGFYHEHERWDRDLWIDIIWQNIDRGALDQFGKVDLTKTSYYEQPYDYKSILHYDSLAFSKNGFPTMLPKKQGLVATIGNAKDFSEIDLAKINRMYKCDQRQIVQIPGLYSHKAQVAPIYSPAYDLKGQYARPPVSGHAFFDEGKHTKTSQCEDRITVCWWTQDRCLSPNIYLMMKTLCPKTCRFC
ncbi:astacin (Peptidase family m12A) domain-containing protein [Ditylenchus destructor]|uniref:Metalloendopeptidase n=1 Tax=Ditylenchus destructor TaxID=166010 RepID=A0AAD4RDJ7_9BILA|nr:astacin (Peptidase family m12A) domain-containing protein [Ditylenchus destructor]